MSLSPLSFSVWINKLVVILENLEVRCVLVAAQRKAKAAAEIRYLSRFPYRVGSAPVGTEVYGVESLKSQSRLTIGTGFVTWHPDVWAPFILETKNNTWKQPKLLSKADILQCNLFYDQISRECSSWTCPKRHVLNFILELSNIKGPAQESMLLLRCVQRRLRWGSTGTNTCLHSLSASLGPTWQERTISINCSLAPQVSHVILSSTVYTHS